MRSLTSLATRRQATAAGARAGQRQAVDLAFVARGVVTGIAVLGALEALACALLLVRANSGGLAYDTQAYWLAGRHVLDGAPLYAPATISTYAAYKYPPLFAQLFVPAAVLPDLAVSWLWRLSGLLCLRYLAGSWKATLFWCAFAIPTIRELSLGNVTLQIGALMLFSIRHPRGAAVIPWIAALKFGPALLVPYLWLAVPRSRAPLLAGLGALIAACGVSYLAAPGLWHDYVATYGWETANEISGAMVIAIVPFSGGLDFLVRFSIAGAVACYAAVTRRAWLAFAAAAITVPVLDVGRFAPLVALWPFWVESRRSGRPEAAGRPAVEAPAAAEPAPLSP